MRRRHSQARKDQKLHASFQICKSLHSSAIRFQLKCTRAAILTGYRHAFSSPLASSSSQIIARYNLPVNAKIINIAAKLPSHGGECGSKEMNKREGSTDPAIQTGRSLDSDSRDLCTPWCP